MPSAGAITKKNASTATPRIMRYTPNAVKVWRRTKPMSHLMATIETTNATRQPTAMMAISLAPNVPPSNTTYFTSLSALAPNITGIAKKNVNSAATERVVPSSRPPMMVDPEREVPGMSESTWNTPIPSAIFQESSSMVVMAPKSPSGVDSTAAALRAKCAPAGRLPGTTPAAATRASKRFALQRSMTMNAMPYTISASATTGALYRCSSMKSSSGMPITAAGMHASTILPHKRHVPRRPSRPFDGLNGLS